MSHNACRTLRLDILTASVALPDLAEHGNDLSTLGRAVDEDWQRFGPPPSIPPGIERRHFISTMTNRQDSPPTGHSYEHTQFIQPGPVRAEHREPKDRFLKGKPLLTAEVTRTDAGYTLETAILRMGLHLTAVLDWARGHATFYVLKGQIPDTLMSAATGRPIGDIVNVGHCEDLVIQHVYVAEMDELRGVLGQLWTPSIAIRTDLPGWTEVAFQPTYEAAP